MIYRDKNRIIILVVALVVVSVIILYSYSPCLRYSKIDIERDLDKKSEDILLNSANDTEIVHRIIAWENEDLALKAFKGYEILRSFSHDPHWYIFLRKANCGERAVIFEDMAKRTNLTYRKVAIDGYINPTENRTPNNHRWSEVWLDNDWRIADSGFNLNYPEDNQSYFTSVEGYLIGHVAFINDNGTFGDCTDRYVNRTGKLIIQAVKDEENIEDADVSVTLIYKHLSCPVAGNKIKPKTNDSGLCEINLGIYEGTNYQVSLRKSDGIFFEYFGQETVTIANETNSLVIELDRKIRWEMVAGRAQYIVHYFI